MLWLPPNHPCLFTDQTVRYPRLLLQHKKMHTTTSAQADTNSNFVSNNDNNKITSNSDYDSSPPKLLLWTAYQKIHHQKRAKKQLKLSPDEKEDLSLKHLESFAAHKVCYNVQGGAHCRCTCFHILRDFIIWSAVAKWCVQFAELKKQNKIKLFWTGCSTQHF